MNKAKSVFVAFAAMLAATAYAEVDPTFVFTDANGNVIPNGSTITVTESEFVDDGDEGYYQIPSGVYVKNTTNEDMGADAVISVSRLDNGAASCCFPENCLTFSATGAERNATSKIGAGESKSIQAEWLYAGEGQATMTLVIGVYEYALGKFDIPYYTEIDLDESEKPTITINYVYKGTGVSDINAGNVPTVVARYSAAGKRLQAPQKGINILKLSDGTTVKEAVK